MKSFKIAAVAAAALALGATSAQADIKIATAGPMTGQYASFGEQMQKGAEMAVKDLNANGGVLGQKIELLIGDDACDPKQAVAVANEMVNKGVVFMAGHFCSSSSIPASEVYNEEGLLQMTPASTNPKFTERGLDNVFRTCGRDDQQGAVAGAYLVDNFGGKRVAFLHDKTAYGKGLADETIKVYKAKGGAPVMYEAYTAGEKDYSALVSKLKNAKVDVIYLGGYHTEGGLIIRQARAQGLNAVLVSGDALVSSEFASIAGKAGDGTLFSFSPDPRKNPDAASVVAAFAKDGYNPEGYTLYTYAAIQAWAQAATAAGSTDLAKIKPALHAGSFATVLGKIGFDAKGDPALPGYVFYEWKNGTYDYVK